MRILIFPKTEIGEICKRTKITRAPCRRRNGEAVPRAVNFGDLITADHKVLSDNCESRNNHRYAVVVQDLATQWIQAYPCKNKTSQETQRSLQKFLEPNRKPKVIYTDNSLELGKACEDLSWNHCTSTPHRSETNGIAERAVRRVKGRHLCCIAVGVDEETQSHLHWQFPRIWPILWRLILESLYVNTTQIRNKWDCRKSSAQSERSAVLLQSGLGNEWWADSLECCCYLRNIQDLLSDEKTPYERRVGKPLKGPILEQMDSSEIHVKRLNAKDVWTHHNCKHSICPVSDGTVKTNSLEEMRLWEHPP